jgi:DNA-binding LacI/PurR family transcriptional regulator
MITLEEVARKAGVSVSTVSRALTRPDRVAKGTREKIIEAANALGYAPNQLARSLRQRASRTIGLIISDIQVPFHSEVAKGVEDTAQAHGYTTILCNSDEDGAKERTYLDLLKGFRVSGIILEPTEENGAAIEAITRGGTPVVEVDRISGAKGVSSVLSENLAGSIQAVQHLAGLGHTRIGLIGSDTKLTSGRERLKGFQDAMCERKLELREPWTEIARQNTDDEGFRTTKRMFQANDRPDALFVASSALTGGVLRALRELNLRIPKDVSVVSFDDPRWASFIDPPLTVIAQDAYGLGVRATEIILSSLEGKHQPRRALKGESLTVRLPTRLVLRESSSSPKPVPQGRANQKPSGSSAEHSIKRTVLAKKK